MNLLIQEISADQLKLIITEIMQEELKKLQPAPITTPKYLSQKEAAKLLGVCTVTILKYTRAGLIPSLRIGSTIRYIQSDVENCLMNRQTLKFGRSENGK